MKVERIKALSSDPHRNQDQLTDETVELEDCLIRSFIDIDHESSGFSRWTGCGKMDDISLCHGKKT